jgi:hypothetical protein
MILSDILGTIGVIMMLAVFILNIADQLSNDSPIYIVANLIGASLACAASIMISYLPFVFLEGTWALVSVWALYTYFVRDYPLRKIRKEFDKRNL